MSNEYVPLKDLPDLHTGNLLLVEHIWPGGIPLEERLYVMEAGRFACRSRAEVARGDFEGRREDLADDRWPETERRLREAPPETAARPDPRPALKVGDVVRADQWDSLPVGAVVPQRADGGPEFVKVKRDTGWCCVWWSTSNDPSRTVSELASVQTQRPDLRLLALNCTATDRTELARQMAAAGIGSAARWLKHHESPVKVAEAPKIGDKVHTGESGRLPAGTVVELPGTGGYDYVMVPGQVRHVRMGTYELRENDTFPPPSYGCGGVIVALDVPIVSDRRELARMLAQRGVASLQSACDEAGVEWRKPEPELASTPNLRPGDRVRIVKKSEAFARPDKWVTQIDATIGRTGEVLGVLTGGDVRVRVEGTAGFWVYPADALEPVRQPLQEAASATTLQPEPRPPLKPGDRVDGRWDELPPGSVVDVRDGSGCPLLTRCADHGWSWTGLTREQGILGPARWHDGIRYQSFERWPDAVFAGQVPVELMGEAFVRALADQGYEPARELLRRQEAPEHSNPRVGDEVSLTRDAWKTLPPGTLVQLERGERLQREYGRTLVCGDGLKYVTPRGFEGPAMPWDVGDVRRAVVVAVDVPASSASVAAAIRAPTSPQVALPQPGDRLDADALRRLPVGAVVDTHDGSQQPWAVKAEGGWQWVAWWQDGRFTRVSVPDLGTSVTLVALESPSDHDALRAWCAERGYEHARRVESWVTKTRERKQIIDDAASAAQNQEMPSQLTTLTLPGGATITQHHNESDADFASRVGRLRVALDRAHPATEMVTAHQTQPGALARIGAAFKQIGGDFARETVDAVVDQKSLALVDAGRLAGSKAAVAAAEWIGGEGTAVKVLRAAQSPLAPVVVDGAVSVFAAMLGAKGLAQVTRARCVRAAVQGTGSVVVDKGFGVVTQLAQAAGALVAASSAAAELTEDVKVEGEVQS